MTSIPKYDQFPNKCQPNQLVFKSPMKFYTVIHSLSLLLFLGSNAVSAEPEFPLTEDSKVHADIPHGELITSRYTAKEGSVFPGTERDYTLYIPPGYSIGKTFPFMVFQDGVIYDAPVVLDNLIAKKQIPPLVGIFIKPGVVPAANPNAIPRNNRCYEYDSISNTFTNFLIDEFLPAIAAKHELALSSDPDDAAIAGNSSGGICAFMVGWHRPDRFRRIFSGVGTYVGIHGGDQLPVLIRKYEPKPLRVFLQSGTNDNNLYCGDWWLANQMMERSLTWAGYDVNHAWGEGGHSQEHASQIFPDVLRWLWRDYATGKQIKANPRGESKWKGFEVIGDGKWEEIKWPSEANPPSEIYLWHVTSNKTGEVFALRGLRKMHDALKIDLSGQTKQILAPNWRLNALVAGPKESLYYALNDYGGQGEKGYFQIKRLKSDGSFDESLSSDIDPIEDMVALDSGVVFSLYTGSICKWENGKARKVGPKTNAEGPGISPSHLAVSPDQTRPYASDYDSRFIASYDIRPDGSLSNWQKYYELELNDSAKPEVGGLCVDSKGWLYVATALGIQVCDQAGRVNFIIPTPQQPHDVCFGGKDLTELFIACGDKIYKRSTKAHGYISGQMAPLKLPPPKS